MPREGKFSPAFHVVSPSTEPAHSFCQIFFPIAAFCDELSVGNPGVAADADGDEENGEQPIKARAKQRGSVFIKRINSARNHVGGPLQGAQHGRGIGEIFPCNGKGRAVIGTDTRPR